MTFRETTRTFPVVNPASGEVIDHIPDHTPEDAHRAAEQSAQAFESWKRTTAYERAAIMKRWHGLMLQHEDEMARLMSREMGKPIRESHGEVRYSAGFVEWYAEEAKRVYGEVIPTHHVDKRLFATRQPVGPALAITPWNFPAAMIARKAAPALAAGCTMIVKPAEQSPLTAIYLAKLWEEAGGPEGTLLVLTTADPAPLVDVLMNDSRIRKITFTGSTEIGKLLYAKAAPTMKRISMELGGHAPFLVFEDADIDAAVKEVAASKFRNAGQTCVCANRIYVHEAIAQPFAEKLTEAVRALKVGDPLDEATQIGPLIDEQGLAKVQRQVDDAVRKGAALVTGGRVMEGLYYAPTVLTNIQPGMEILEIETFGPVAPVMVFREEAEAVRMANAVPYGLAAYLYTNDVNRAVRIAEALEYGIVGVNDGLPSTPQAPFGGFKESGLLREGGKWGIEPYLEVKYISLGLH
ncbi:MAG: NAD-dependent succinate-semialdehyde dehydrogenase [bacterium]|nr:NAD-dependent succinate-semialdehyde dehydrogenase [bacterium]